MLNLLPFDGKVLYMPYLFDAQTAQHYFNTLRDEINWQQDVVRMFGKELRTKRKTAWHGDEGISYTYSKVKRLALPWTKCLRNIQQKTESTAAQPFNAVLLNLYHNGREGMAWHSDDEKEMNPLAEIASISLGAERIFQFRHKLSGQIISIRLAHGSLLLMDHASQVHWQHRLPLVPVRQANQGPRINLTFRNVLRK